LNYQIQKARNVIERLPKLLQASVRDLDDDAKMLRNITRRSRGRPLLPPASLKGSMK
jgi:hypothetical protein